MKRQVRSTDVVCALGAALLTVTFLLGLVQLGGALGALSARGAPTAPAEMAAPAYRRATLTPRPTRTRLASATAGEPRPGGELLRDGGFEVGDAWEIIPTAHSAGYVDQPAAYVTNPVHSGRRALCLGVADAADVYSHSAAEQWLTIPADAAAVRLTLWAYLVTADSSGDEPYVLIMKDGRTAYDCLLQGLPAADGWQQLEFSLDAYRGQRIAVHFEVKNDGDGAPTALYVDDVSLTVEDGAEP